MNKMKLLLYCTKSKPYLYQHFKGDFLISKTYDESCIWNGKIVAECDFEVEEIFYSDESDIFWTKTLLEEKLCKRSCLNQEDLTEYLNLIDSYSGNSGYAIHIKNIHIFNKPKELTDMKGASIKNFFEIIEKAPQNMQMVLNENLENRILISIRPEYLVKILNGKKTIEIRKKVLKEMLC